MKKEASHERTSIPPGSSGFSHLAPYSVNRREIRQKTVAGHAEKGACRFDHLLFFMPLQLGGREGGFAMSVAQMGMTSDIGMFVSIICRVRELFWTAVGLLLMKVGNKTLDQIENQDNEL